MMMGAAGDGCAADSTSPAPDVVGTWGITYDDTIGEATIGGVSYSQQLGANGGAFTVGGYTFDLDCSRPDVVCPSKAWPNQVVIDQDNVKYPHQMIVNLPQAQCQGSLVKPTSCGSGTNNPNCDLVCDGDVNVAAAQALGVIGQAGDSFRLYLGGGIVSNGINCAMLGYSVADADLDTTKASGAWDATAMQSGLVTIGYSGACLFAGAGGDQGVVAGAELQFTTGFTGAKQ